MKAFLSMKELSVFEANEDILNFRFNFQNMLMWPYIRFDLFQAVYDSILELEFPPTPILKISYQHFPSYIYNALNNHPFTKDDNDHNDILIICSAMGCIKNANKQYFNRTHDYFAFEYKDKTLMLEISDQGRFYKPRTFPNIKYLDSLFLAALLSSKLKRLHDSDRKGIDQFILFLKEKLSYPLKESVWNQAHKKLSAVSKMLSTFYPLFFRILEKKRPKLLILDNASYGTRSYILKWTKAHGIITAEAQHGSITKNHTAYNYDDTLLRSEYKDYLPDYLLTYGDYWQETCNTASRLITIGYPHLTEYQKSAIRKQNDKKKILFISAASIPSKCIDLALQLKSVINPSQFVILFRPHPAESHLSQTRYNQLVNNGIAMSVKNLYDELHDTDFVISAEISTVLFESMFFHIPIFVYDHPLITKFVPSNTFHLFNNVREIAEQVVRSNKPLYNPDHFWDMNWAQNYHNFIESTIYKK